MRTEPGQLLLLLTWMSPAFPVGAFAYSHGLEWAIESGAVKDGAALKSWIEDLLTRGSGWNDAVLFARCWEETPSELNELALALAVSRERHLETTQLGRAFRIAAGVFAAPPLDDDEIAYPVAAGAACAAMAIGRDQALLAYLQGFSAALVSVAVRLVPIGQTAGLETLRDLAPVIASVASRALSASLADLGAITIAADIAAMRHETQHSRVFRS
ncbi:MAG: urease accessory protein UreF [Aestuariivirga sp.]|uniref:urease accessory protein UreF n=1 Tax=Aestuariivirga sp. TaxID=2650926 RepID=UPI0038CF2E84